MQAKVCKLCLWRTEQAGAAVSMLTSWQGPRHNSHTLALYGLAATYILRGGQNQHADIKKHANCSAGRLCESYSQTLVRTAKVQGRAQAVSWLKFVLRGRTQVGLCHPVQSHWAHSTNLYKTHQRLQECRWQYHDNVEQGVVQDVVSYKVSCHARCRVIQGIVSCKMSRDSKP